MSTLLSSGIEGLDDILHGGFTPNRMYLCEGVPGSGKTTLGMQFMKEAAGRGERSVVYTFEEVAELLVRRSESVNIPVGLPQPSSNIGPTRK